MSVYEPVEISAYFLYNFYMTYSSGKRIYGVGINARLMDDFFMNLGAFKRAAKRGNVGKEFEKRIMLAVTQVNGCEMCSYHHTAEALKQGMNKEEIDAILNGEFSDVPNDEIPALLFAQHYADTIAKPDKKALCSFVEGYGEQKAEDILCYIRAIMMGNAQGNIMGALKNRFKGKPEQGSTFFKEISVLFCDIFIIPVFMLKSIVTNPIRRKNNAIPSK